MIGRMRPNVEGDNIGKSVISILRHDGEGNVVLK